MFFDTHAHYDDKAFDDDREELLTALSPSGVDAVINPGCDLASSEKAAEIAAAHSFVWFAAGIHPEELANIPENYPDILRALAARPKCVAIGEIGLDYYWDASQKDLQKLREGYKEQRTIAKNVNFGTFYGLFPRGLQKTLKFKAGVEKSVYECEEIIDNLKAGYKELTVWQETTKAVAARRMYTETWLGRRRYLPNIRSDDWGKKSFAERCSLNTAIQGTAADVLKLSLGRLITGLPAETAASASASIKRPTITESATLYSCVTIVPSRMGTAKRRRFCMIGPSVRSILRLPGVIIPWNPSAKIQ